MAPIKDYVDRLSGKVTAKVTTGQIYWGAVPFVLIQVLMVALIIAVPAIVGGGIVKKADVDTNKLEIQVPDAEVGAGAKSENDMENALERELGDDTGTAPPADAQDAAKGGAGKTDAAKSEAGAKPPVGRKN